MKSSIKNYMMNRRILLLAYVFFCLSACSPSPNNTQEGKTVDVASQEAHSGPSCYLFTTDRDTVYLVLDPPLDGKITGELSYDFYERDGNIGFIEGKVQRDTLIADYTFLSEGTVSVREVGFLLGENQVVEGYGDVEEVDGKMVFWHKDSLDFSNGLIMPKVPCGQLKRIDYLPFFPDSIIQQRTGR
jgi:hypothetical protein